MAVAKAMKSLKKSSGQKLKSLKGKEPVAKAMKSLKNPEQKLKLSKGKGPTTPILKSPKDKSMVTLKGVSSIASAPKAMSTIPKTPKGMFTVTKTPKETSTVAKTAKGTSTVARTPKGTSTVAKTLKVAKTPIISDRQASALKQQQSPVQFPKRQWRGGKKTSEKKKLPKPNPSLGTPTPTPTIEMLWVSNVRSFDPITISRIRDLLAHRGEITEIIKVKRGLAVYFKTAEEARAAKLLDGVLFNGQPMSIKHFHDDLSSKIVTTNAQKRMREPESQLSLETTAGADILRAPNLELKSDVPAKKQKTNDSAPEAQKIEAEDDDVEDDVVDEDEDEVDNEVDDEDVEEEEDVSLDDDDE